MVHFQKKLLHAKPIKFLLTIQDFFIFLETALSVFICITFLFLFHMLDKAKMIPNRIYLQFIKSKDEGIGVVGVWEDIQLCLEIGKFQYEHYYMQ